MFVIWNLIVICYGIMLVIWQCYSTIIVSVPQDWSTLSTKLSRCPRPAWARIRVRHEPWCAAHISVASKCMLQGAPHARSVLRSGSGQHLGPTSLHGNCSFALSPLRAQAMDTSKTMPWWDMSQPRCLNPTIQTSPARHGQGLEGSRSTTLHGVVMESQCDDGHAKVTSGSHYTVTV
jgi:hypothetical protein